MRSITTLALLICCLVLLSRRPCDATCLDDYLIMADSELSIGNCFRQDTLSWQVEPTDENSVIKESWRHINMTAATVDARLLVCSRYLFILDGCYGWFHRHSLQQITKTDLSSGELTANLFSSPTGFVFDLSALAGYQLCIKDKGRKTPLLLTPLAGYAYHEQRFQNNRYQDALEPRGTPSTALGNSYKYFWGGPLAGLEMRYQLSCRWQMQAFFGYHWDRYKAHLGEFDINGRQKAPHCIGKQAAFAVRYECNHWMFRLYGEAKRWMAGHGDYKTTLYGTKAPLSKLRWESWQAGCDLGYHF